MTNALKHIGAMEPYQLADLSPPSGKLLVSLAQNEGFRPPSPNAIEAAKLAMVDAQLYPDLDWRELREAIGEVHSIAPQTILCGAGSMELIACVAHAFLGPRRRVLASQYSYAFIKSVTQFTNAEIDMVEEVDFTVSIENLLKNVRAETKIVFVANPGNPTGTRIPNEQLRRLRAELPNDVMLIIDEAYGEFADGQDASLFDLADTSNTVILRTFSKAYGLAGMRVGWGKFPSQIAIETRKLLNPNNISSASQAAASAAIRDQIYLKETCAQTEQIRILISKQLQSFDLVVPQSYTNFVLAKFASVKAAQSAEAMLNAEGIIPRNMAGYGLADCIRFTIAEPVEMANTFGLLETWYRNYRIGGSI